MMERRPALGKGLSALIPDAPTPAAIQTSVEVDVDQLAPNRDQPRLQIDDARLDELAQSIRVNGVIQPIVVHRAASGYRIIAGERRWRAAQRAGLRTVPVVIREVSDASPKDLLQLALIENIQREDLNPIEEARAYERLMSEFHLTQEEVASKTGKDRATIGNATRLLRLEKQILDLIEDGHLTPGHGRALLAIADPQLRLALAQRAARGRMTVRQLERSGTRRTRAAAPESAEPQLDANTRAAIEEMEHMLGMRVRLRQPTKNRPGELAIEYLEDSQLVWLYDRLVIQK